MMLGTPKERKDLKNQGKIATDFQNKTTTNKQKPTKTNTHTHPPNNHSIVKTEK